jgi:trehalose 6-phosphate synthase/phosphatase
MGGCKLFERNGYDGAASWGRLNRDRVIGCLFIMGRIINVANRLPVTVGDTLEKSSGGLISALEGAAADKHTLEWVGWPGSTIDDPARQQTVSDTLAQDFGFHCVFLSEAEIASYYMGLSNSSLWPILHHMTTYMRYDESEWAVYEEVNRRFAEKTLEVAEPGDLIWVHDYHLLLLPQMLREQHPDLRVGFFFHTPFPSSEVFRCHPRRRELLQGILGADQIGFHTYGYLRHFRSTLLRLLGVESEMNRIQDGQRLITLGVYPIGINSSRFEKELASRELEERRDAFRANWGDKRVLLSVERLDYTKGLVHRLEAVELFLDKYPERVNHVKFVFVSVPSRGEVREYRRLLEEIEGLVGKINGKHATVENSPIHFIHNPVPFTDLCALYSMADVALVTPLVDGMNLVSKEYVACQTDGAGVLILSEFAGAAQELVNALQVNPYDLRQVSETILAALDMELKEKTKRMRYMRERVLHYDADYWACTYLDDLAAVETKTEQPIEFAEAENAIAEKMGVASRIAFFLDYDGTLREFEALPKQAFPHDALHAVLRRLESQSDMDVYIISGRQKNDLEEWLGQYAFTLIAEHGNSYSIPFSDEWTQLYPNADMSWKDRVIEVLDHYVGSTPGSFIEIKTSAVVWHYRQSDPEFGQWKAHQLMSEIVEMLSNLPVEIHHGKKIVEISSIHVNKGAAVEHFLAEKSYDLVLCAGDDQTDEAMFRLAHDDMLSVKIGVGDTHAQYRIQNPEAFRHLLQRILDVKK